MSGVGAGKTRMGVEEIIKWTQLYPGSLGIIGRLTTKSLRETTQRRFFEVCDPKLIANYNKSEEHLWMHTGQIDEEGKPVYSEILFFHLDNPGPLGSLDISWFWIDEAHEPDGQEVPESTFQMLTARLRHPIGPHRGFITSNSGGKDWVWRRFFNPETTYKQYVGWNVPTSANAEYLPEGYEEELRANNPATWVARFLEGSFDAFDGQIWVDFNEAIHVFSPEDVELSTKWDYGAGFDFGITAPTACIYGCVDKDKDIWVYHEDYQADADITGFAKLIKKQGFKHINSDPSVVAKGVGKKSPKDLYQEEGVYLIPASNDEDYFMALFGKLLRKRNKNGTGVLHISKKCEHLINQIKQEAWDATTLIGSTHDRVKKGVPNHARDAFKYFLNTYGLNPGLLDPIISGQKTVELHECKGKWEHESFWEDEDFDSDDYSHPEIKGGH